MAAKNKRIEIRLTDEHKTLIEDAATLRGQSVSAFLVSEGLERAQQMQTTDLSRRDWEGFLDVMDRDEEPTAALVAAAKKHAR